MVKNLESTAERALLDITPAQIKNIVQGIAYGLYGAASIIAARRSKASTTDGSIAGVKTNRVERAVSDAMELGLALGTLWRSLKDLRAAGDGRMRWLARIEDVMNGVVVTGQGFSSFLEDIRQGALDYQRSRSFLGSRFTTRVAFWLGGLTALAGGGYGGYLAYERVRGRKGPVAERVTNRMKSWIGISAVAFAGLVGYLACGGV